MGLLAVDSSQAGTLFEALLEGDADEFLAIGHSLRDHADRSALAQRCRDLLRNERETPSRRFRAGMALASQLGDTPAPDDATLRTEAAFFTEYFLAELLTNPDRYSDWPAALRPAAPILIPSLEAAFRDTRRADSVRFLAATVLAQIAEKDPDTLTELLLDANARQFPVIVHALYGFQASVAPRLARLITDAPPAGAPPEARYAFVARQANAAIALLHCGESGRVWPLLRQSPDPLLRTYLIDRLPRLAPDPPAIVERLAGESDVSARRALVLIVGGIPTELRSPSWAGRAAEQLLELFERDPDAGIHSAAESALRRWDKEETLRRATMRLPVGNAREGQAWYLTGNGHTMARLPGPIRFRMGASNYEEESDHDETPVIREIPRSFWIAAKETTAEQYLESRKVKSPHDLRRERGSAIDAVSWYNAVAYCRWLSEREHVPPDEMCYPPIEEIKAGMKPYPNYLNRTGYRLPTEAEFEYACRAGAGTSRFFGDDPKMLPRYAWFTNNAEGVIHRTGLRLPNDFGLFDVLGNVKEWCQGSYKENPVAGPDREDDDDAKVIYVVARGGCYADRAMLSVPRIAIPRHPMTGITPWAFASRERRGTRNERYGVCRGRIIDVET